MAVSDTVLTGTAGLFDGLLTFSVAGVSLMTLLGALVVFLICFAAMRLLTRLASRALSKSRLEGALRSFVLGGVWLNVIARPDFIAYGPGRKPLSVRIAEALGAFRVRWTVRPEDEPAAREKENDCVIFEFYRPEPRFH